LRRLLIAWAEGDLSKIPFSDAITPDSRLLMNRNIYEIVNGSLHSDLRSRSVCRRGCDGNLYWILDAFTETSTYPYSRHHKINDNDANYVRNSVKVVIDAYNGTTNFYVFDPDDPLIAAYRATFPSLFRDASQMPADLRAHVRYPETLLRVQGDVFGTVSRAKPPRVLSTRGRVELGATGRPGRAKSQTGPGNRSIFCVDAIAGRAKKTEFALILPFTPANRNNMIGWMAGRSDGEDYGKLLAYNFPKSTARSMDPCRFEARIDQNAQLSAQFSLWNQQGSRGGPWSLARNSIGKSLLYVEPFYLKAESSPDAGTASGGASRHRSASALGSLSTKAMSNLVRGCWRRRPAEQKPALSKSHRVLRLQAKTVADTHRLRN
jgi:uncharacterized membrane protein (UPF0182 family)